VQEDLSLANRLAGSCHAAYLKARPKVRTRFNQAVLQAVYIKDWQIQRAEFTQVFEALFSRPSSSKRAAVGAGGWELRRASERSASLAATPLRIACFTHHRLDELAVVHTLLYFRQSREHLAEDPCNRDDVLSSHA
jgi:hypothetical protein